MAKSGNYMLRRPKHSKNKVVTPKEEEEEEEDTVAVSASPTSSNPFRTERTINLRNAIQTANKLSVGSNSQ